MHQDQSATHPSASYAAVLAMVRWWHADQRRQSGADSVTPTEEEHASEGQQHSVVYEDDFARRLGHLPVTKSARAHSYFLSKQVQKT